jgi:NAD(P)-dependent dehydrogenase (short-subunit alcohol dehydrogenase family)
MINNLSAKTFVVTGATSGIGLKTTEILAGNGAMVIGIGRSAERCSNIEAQLRRQTANRQVHYLVADLCLQKNIRNLANQIKQLVDDNKRNCLDGFVNNAGTFTYWLSLTEEGYETQWAVNHLAPFLLTQLLLPLMEKAPQARIVTVSSDSHFFGRIDWDDPQLRRRYSGLKAYGNTKLANILFTSELNKREKRNPNIRAFAVDPGLVKTDIGMKGTPALVGLFWKLRRSGGIEAVIPAEGIVYLLTEPSIQNSPQVYWKESHHKTPSKSAMDVESANRLWMLSEKMCGLQG